MSRKIQTTAYQEQKPGTSGLRKRVAIFKQKDYTENFIQAILNAIPAEGASLLVGGDGRYFSKEAIQIIIKLAAGNNVNKLYVAKNGILSTPGISHKNRSCIQLYSEV